MTMRISFGSVPEGTSLGIVNSMSILNLSYDNLVRLSKDAMDAAGVDGSEKNLELVATTINIDDLIKYPTSCGSGDRLIKADEIQILRNYGIENVAVLTGVTDKERCILAMAAHITQRRADRFSRALSDASLRSDFSSVRGWAIFESE